MSDVVSGRSPATPAGLQQPLLAVETGRPVANRETSRETTVAEVPKLSVIETHRHPTKAERERDKAVLERLLREYDGLPEPRPDLSTWLNGATSALLALRDLTDE